MNSEAVSQDRISSNMRIHKNVIFHTLSQEASIECSPSEQWVQQGRENMCSGNS